MIVRMLSIGVLAAAVAASAHAQPPAAPPSAVKPARACFFKQQMNGWKEVGDRQVNIRVSVRDVYEIALDSPCWNLKWSQSLGIESRGSSSICTGDTVDVIVPDRATGPDRCFGRVVRKLTPEQVAALPPKQRP
jgi:hypothetical protein